MNEIIYLDSAATMQKSDSVVREQVEFLCNHYANSGRGICARSAYVDNMLAVARRRVAAFMGADAESIVFTSGATDGLNRALHLIGGGHLRVAVSDLDHNSARVPWQMRDDTEIVLWALDADFNLAQPPMADIYVLTAMSNVLGVAQNVEKLSADIRKLNPNAIIVVDAAQYVVHEKIDAQKWDADFICWSGHKVGSDTGIGVMYVRNPGRWRVDKFGGGMVRRALGVDIDLYDGVARYEAGTLPLTQIAGLVPAIDYIEKNRPDLNLIKYMHDELSKIGRIKILTARDATLLTFMVDGMHPLDFGALMGAHDVCVRVGNMCASNAVRAIGGDDAGVVRISVGGRNNMDEIKTAIQVIKDIVK